MISNRSKCLCCNTLAPCSISVCTICSTNCYTMSFHAPHPALFSMLLVAHTPWNHLNLPLCSWQCSLYAWLVCKGFWVLMGLGTESMERLYMVPEPAGYYTKLYAMKNKLERKITLYKIMWHISLLHSVVWRLFETAFQRAAWINACICFNIS